jgi:hypothetical protein
VGFVVSPHGRVTDVDASGDQVLNLWLELCLEDRVRAWVVEPPGMVMPIATTVSAGDGLGQR